MILIGGLLSARFISGFFVDYLWHDSVGRGDVFWGVLRAKVTLFAMFAATFVVLAWLNLVIADRLAPTSFSANVHPVVERFHEFFGSKLRLARFAIAGVIALLMAGPAIGRWQDWLMFRNSKSFGINDPHFGNDVGFYMFKLPFVTFVIDWLFIAVAIVTVLVVATHVLSGGILLQPPRPKVRKATKAHVAVLLALLALLKAADYWVTRYELTTADRGAVRGITYAVDNAQLPAVLLLAMIAVLTAVLYLSALKTDRWRPAVVASGLWAVVALVGGVIYPTVVQSLVVNPNQKEKEAKYIAYNIDATRHALGIDNVEVKPIEFGDVTAGSLTTDVAALQDARLIKPINEMETRYQTDRPQPNTKITDVDPDRYTIDGVERQVIVGARELDLSQVGNKSWQGTHLINTHGCGVVAAPANRIDSARKPAYDDSILNIDRPQLYFGTAMSGYSIVNTSVTETACEGEEVAPYSGTGGVQLNSFFRRAAFALEELDWNLFGSSAITDDSRLMSIRNVHDRVSTIAPFLSLDGDPYPVALDGGVVWVVDAYTTSNRYPYGEGADLGQLGANTGLTNPVNYVRNSVKAVVNAYDGSITLYVVDDSDPVLQVWESAFPDLFTPLDKMPADLREHLRYPEDLFRIQTAAYSKYRLDSAAFFDRKGAWSVALAAPEQIDNATVAVDATATDAAATNTQFASDSSAPRFEPYYTMFHAGGGAEATFELFRPFQPFSTSDQYKNLVAYMTASSDPDSYGKLVAYTLPDGSQEDSPYVVGATMVSTPSVSKYITENNQQGSTVLFGDLQMLPVGDGVVWFRPMYVESKSSGQPLVNRMVVAYKQKVVMADSFTAALVELFPAFKGEVGDVIGTSGDGTGTGTDPGTDPGTGTDTPAPDATAAELLARADELFTTAQTALEAGDLGGYQDAINEARTLVGRALTLLQG